MTLEKGFGELTYNFTLNLWQSSETDQDQMDQIIYSVF
jgi:hypothetical protein